MVLDLVQRRILRRARLQASYLLRSRKLPTREFIRPTEYDNQQDANTGRDYSVYFALEKRIQPDNLDDGVGSYCYLDKNLKPIHYTSVPLNDEEAIRYFTRVSNFRSGFHPVFIQRKPSGALQYKPLDVFYDELTNSTKPLSEWSFGA